MVIGRNEDWKIQVIEQFEGASGTKLNNETWEAIFKDCGMNKYALITRFAAEVRALRAQEGTK